MFVFASNHAIRFVRTITIVQYGLGVPNNADLRRFESVQASGRSDVLHLRVLLLVAN